MDVRNLFRNHVLSEIDLLLAFLMTKLVNSTWITDIYGNRKWQTYIVGRILNDNRNEYLHQVNDFVKWCDVNFLNLNVTKTKEMILDFRKKQTNFPPLVIKSENVERVKEYKCLGVIIDDQLSGSANTKSVYSKCIQRIHHLRILRNIGVDKNILSLFYKSMIESVLCFSITVWYGGLTGKSKHKLEKITKNGRKLGADVVSLSELYEIKCVTNNWKDHVRC